MPFPLPLIHSQLPSWLARQEEKKSGAQSIERVCALEQVRATISSSFESRGVGDLESATAAAAAQDGAAAELSSAVRPLNLSPPTGLARSNYGTWKLACEDY